MDMMFIGYPKCSTSKKAEQWLKDNGFAYKFRNIVEENPTEDELRTWHKKSKLDIKRFFNTSGLKYRELNLKDRLKHMSDDEKYALLATNGMLVKRPILINGDRIITGFNESEWVKFTEK